MYQGFSRVAAAIPALSVADCSGNTQNIIAQIFQADAQHAEVVCFPELSVTAYTCQDLFLQQTLLDSALASLHEIVNATKALEIVSIVGLPISVQQSLYNCAAVIHAGKVLGFVPKTFLPNYKEFYEQRWFRSANELPAGSSVLFNGREVPVSRHQLFSVGGWTFGIEICEDLWAVAPPSCELSLLGADVIFNLSASNALTGKANYRRSLIESQSARCLSGYVYAGCGFGESTQDVVFTGHGYIAENGTMVHESAPYSLEPQIVIGEIDIERLRADRRANTSFAQSVATQSQGNYAITHQIDRGSHESQPFALSRLINPLPFVPFEDAKLNERCEEVLNIQAWGLAKRLSHTHLRTVVLGISGGLDSTLALIVCARAFKLLGLDMQGIIGVTMPGFGTTDRTYNNAVQLMKGLGITMREINIRAACEQHFKDIGHDANVHDVTYENSQARERTQLLMDLANKENALVIGTGDLSELALGWCTYNGDHMSMYAVNVSIPKTLVRHLVRWAALQEPSGAVQTSLLDIVDTPISPELIPADAEGNIVQKTEDLVGPYELHDFFLYHTLRFGCRPDKLYYLAQQAFDGHDHRVHTYDNATIKKWLTTFFRRFFNQQFKRSCLPDGPKVGSCSLSPRGDWRMPSDAVSALWLSACEAL